MVSTTSLPIMIHPGLWSQAARASDRGVQDGDLGAAFKAVALVPALTELATRAAEVGEERDPPGRKLANPAVGEGFGPWMGGWRGR